MKLTLEVHIQIIVISTLDILQKIIDQDLLNIILGKMMQVYGKYFQSHIPTGTQPFQCVSTTTCTNLNADMVDGYHSNDLTKRVFIAGIPGGAGSKWIRIGVLKYRVQVILTL